MSTTISLTILEAEKPVAARLNLRNYIDRKRIFFFFKRIWDIVVSFLVILFIMSWLTPLIALLIKLDSKGPVFFLQQRVGMAGMGFTCFKFRTMVVNPDADKKQAERNDRRITRFGRFLRRSNIDELPQFFNVLAGTMSLVGPRPHMYSDCAWFSSVIPGYKFRNMVKPGITGLAQVRGYHGPVFTYECMLKRYELDSFYIRNAGFVMDLGIVFKTIIRQLKNLG